MMTTDKTPVRSPTPRAGRRVADLPAHALTWDGTVSLRREDIYSGVVEGNGIRLLPVRRVDAVVTPEVVNTLRDEGP